MRRQLQHKRFTIIRNDKLSSPGCRICYGYVQAHTDIELNVNDSIHKRPDYVLAGI
jgi:hypothetical protein